MKYIKLYFKYAKLSIMSKLSYKSNTIIGISAFLLNEIVSVATLYLLVSNVNAVGGWSIYQIGFLYGLVNLAIGFDHLFTDRLWTVAYWEVRKGKLDSVFLRPLPTLFQIIASEIQLEAFGEIFTAIVLLIYTSFNINFSVNALNIILLIVGIIGASICITSFKIIISSFAFRIKTSGPILQIVYNFTQFGKYPLHIYPKFIEIILCCVVPIGLCVYYPALNIMTNQNNPWAVGGVILLACTLFFIISIFIRNFNARKYESTGS
ncbi:MAG: ABC-2 family transporter protein [Candidatus Onthovivens sp.]|nr:ABC-2 family transporter protein [Candidatus Onthovivens sp.]